MTFSRLLTVVNVVVCLMAAYMAGVASAGADGDLSYARLLSNHTTPTNGSTGTEGTSDNEDGDEGDDQDDSNSTASVNSAETTTSGVVDNPRGNAFFGCFVT